MSIWSSSNHSMVSFSLIALAIYMQATAIICGGYTRIRSILYVSLTSPLHRHDLRSFNRPFKTMATNRTHNQQPGELLPGKLDSSFITHASVLKQSIRHEVKNIRKPTLHKTTWQQNVSFEVRNEEWHSRFGNKKRENKIAGQRLIRSNVAHKATIQWLDHLLIQWMIRMEHNQIEVKSFQNLHFHFEDIFDLISVLLISIWANHVTSANFSTMREVLVNRRPKKS